MIKRSRLFLSVALVACVATTVALGQVQWSDCPPGFDCDGGTSEMRCTTTGCTSDAHEGQTCKGGSETGVPGSDWCGSGPPSSNCGISCFYNDEDEYICYVCTDDGNGGCDCDVSQS